MPEAPDPGTNAFDKAPVAAPGHEDSLDGPAGIEFGLTDIIVPPVGRDREATRTPFQAEAYRDEHCSEALVFSALWSVPCKPDRSIVSTSGALKACAQLQIDPLFRAWRKRCPARMQLLGNL